MLHRIKLLLQDRKIQRLLFSIFFSLSVMAILGFLFLREGGNLLAYRWEFNPVPLLISFPLYSFGQWVIAAIWGWIMNTLSKELPFKTHFIYYCISNVTKRLPGTIWYIASRAHLYKNESIDPKLTSLASGIELVLSIMSSILVSLVFGISLLLEKSSNLITAIILFVICGILLHPRFYQWLCRLLKVEVTNLKYSTLLKWLIAFSSTWIISGILLFVIGNIFSTIPLQHLGFVIGSLSMVRVITAVVFFLPSNFGLTEVGLSLFLSTILPGYIAVAIALSFRVIVTLYDVIWALIGWGLDTSWGKNKH